MTSLTRPNWNEYFKEIVQVTSKEVHVIVLRLDVYL